MNVPIKRVVTDHFTMDYFRFGEGEKTLVILPGLSVRSVMDSADAVVAAYKDMAEDFTIYLFERRNELPPVYTIRDMGADTAAAMRTLGLKNVNLFGASMGGMMAIVTAGENPDLVQKLVLGSTAARSSEHSECVLGGWIKLAEQGDAEALYLSFGEKLYPKTVFEQARETLLEHAALSTKEDLERFVFLANAGRSFDIRKELEKIACPTLVLGAEDDAVLGGERSREIADTLKKRVKTELHMYDGYGHACFDTAPDYRERMKRFLLGK